MNRRGFLGALLAASSAPAIARASSLMKLSPIFSETESGIIVPINPLSIITTAGFRVGDLISIAGLTAISGRPQVFRVIQSSKDSLVIDFS